MDRVRTRPLAVYNETLGSLNSFSGRAHNHLGDVPGKVPGVTFLQLFQTPIVPGYYPPAVARGTLAGHQERGVRTLHAVVHGYFLFRLNTSHRNIKDVSSQAAIRIAAMVNEQHGLAHFTG